MNFFLIGRNGQLGKSIYKVLVKKKHKVAAYGREDLDISNFARVRGEIVKKKPDVVINASAYHVVSDCETNPEKAFLINAIAIKNIAEICSGMKIKFVTFSTDYVFDGRKGSRYLENDLPSPVQIYGMSKLSGESAALSYNSDSIVIRTCGVYGGKSGSRAKKGNFALNIISQCIGKKELEVSSEQIVNPTYSEDLAEAVLKLIQKKHAKGIYHLVSEGYCSWAEFAKEIVNIKKLTTKIIPVDRSGQSGGANRPLFSALRNYRAAKLRVVLPVWKNAIRRYLSDYA
jgi:dTDP-4-dehydrorhamnose reductase